MRYAILALLLVSACTTVAGDLVVNYNCANSAKVTNDLSGCTITVQADTSPAFTATALLP